MYKKIKNSSFMNLIWFIIAVFPIMFLIIYSLGNLLVDNKSVKIDNILNYNEQYRETYFENDIQYEKYYNPYFASYYYLTNYGDNQLINDNNYLEFEVYYDQIVDDNILLYFDTLYQDEYYIYLYIDANYYDSQNYISVFTNSVSSIDLENNIIYEFYINSIGSEGIPNFLLSLNNRIVGNLKIFISKEKLNKNLFIDLENWSYIEVSNNKLSFYNYLENINSTMQTNGFISSAFLNLAQLFGVTNVYYSLACYYIEYLLVIALLHLAFDILYMLPNICHKFMEKLGGERD